MARAYAGGSTATTVLATHGASLLPLVEIHTYNATVRDSRGFLGDRASGRAFRALLESERKGVRKQNKDPIGPVSSEDISKKKLDQLLASGNPVGAGVVLGAVEEFSQQFASVINRFLRLKEWRGMQRIVVGGGLRASRVGELAIGRAAGLLKANGHHVELLPIRHDPDEAGLIGCVHLAPRKSFAGHDAILAVDIGGSNIRAGVVVLNAKKSANLAKAVVWNSELWRHAEEQTSRDGAVRRLVAMLEKLIGRAEKRGLSLAPFIGIGCPGIICEDGSIKSGGQNLPGNWEHRSFNLPELVRGAVTTITQRKVCVVMHNDAVVQGLSEAPFMRDTGRWGVLTLGTGLGNACFTNVASSKT